MKKNVRNAIVKYAAPKNNSTKATITKEKEKTMKKVAKPTKSVKQTVSATRNHKKENIVKKSTKQVITRKGRFTPTISEKKAKDLQQMFFDQKNGTIKRSKWSEAVEKIGLTQKAFWETVDHFGLINHRS